MIFNDSPSVRSTQLGCILGRILKGILLMYIVYMYIA
jgi:hypothetical protein